MDASHDPRRKASVPGSEFENNKEPYDVQFRHSPAGVAHRQPSHRQPSHRQPSYARRFRAHMRRHIWWYSAAAGFAIFLVIFLPIFFLIAVPEIIQSTIDNARLPISAGYMQPLTASTVRLGLTTELSTPAGAAVRLDPFTLELYNPGSGPTFATLSVPAQNLRGATPVEIPTQDVRVEDAAELAHFVSTVFAGSEGRGAAVVGVRGDFVARFAASSYPVRVDKEVRFGGLRSLGGLRVEDTDVSEDREADGTNLRGSFMVPNPSKVTVGLGNVTYDVLVGGVRIGQAFVDDLQLEPGNQALTFRGVSDDEAVVDNLEKLVGAMDEETSDIQFTVVGSSSTVNGEHIPYLDDVLSRVKVASGIPFCEGVKMVNMDLLGLDQVDVIDADLLWSCPSMNF